MKQLILFTMLLTILTGCGKSEEDKKKEAEALAVAKGQAQLAAMQIEHAQREAVMEGLKYMAGMKSFMIDYYIDQGECLSSSKDSKHYDLANKLSKSVLDEAKLLKTFSFRNDCSVEVTFFESASTPDLNGETLTLKMTPMENGTAWQCSFSGPNKKDVPKTCQ